ncbi:hypothetical protein SISSUDRAFT_1045078 [Sistotremastrum suecicum HHB10207 ss-3]|uniref:F-box domain-containing protein n=1 Tax=Sistotremastrum suecicum HHB10207 ss-3 TaxID=1314776 RepID=A0A166EN40_9AGAM|nr:hypothetical protein SISSUDRAFT_1045078 [Sistotremastrum suecicum HHB10207 ss-3]
MATKVFNASLFSILIPYLEDDYKSLATCCLVNVQFHDAFTPVLYRKLSVVVPSNPYDEAGTRSQLWSCRSPHLAPHVQELVLTGHLAFPQHMERETSTMQLVLDVLPLLKGLRSFVCKPQIVSKEIFEVLLDAINVLPLRETFHVNRVCMETETAAQLIKDNIRRLTLESPRAANLVQLQSQISKLHLLELHLTDDCGSASPRLFDILQDGVTELEAFTFGLCYSITNNQIFRFLDHMNHLKRLELHYYVQLGLYANTELPALQHLVVHHAFETTVDGSRRICKWIRSIIGHSSIRLLELKLLDPFSLEEHLGLEGPSFDALMTHLALKHPNLRRLDAEWSYVSQGVLRKVVDRCVHLEWLALSIHVSSLGLLRSSTELKLLRAFRCHLRGIIYRKSKLTTTEEIIGQLFSGSSWSVSTKSLRWDRVVEAHR